MTTPPQTQQIDALFNKLTQFPIDKTPIRYIQQYNSRSQQANIMNYIITENINRLVPNIDVGYQTNAYTQEELITWITTSKQYLDQINQTFQEQCDKQLQKLYQIEGNKTRSRNFDIDKLSKLPEDIILHIRRFLLPECRISELIAAHPDYLQNLQKLTAKNLQKFFIHSIYRPYYILGIMTREPKFYMSGTFKNKSNCINEIDRLYQIYNNKIAKTSEEYNFFQSKALKILQTIIYVGYHTGKRLHKN